MKSGFENGRRVPVVLADGHQEDAGGHDPAHVEIPVEFPLSEEEKKHIEEVVKLRLFEAQCELLRKVLFLFIGAKFPKRMAYQLMYASGMGEACGGSSASLAKTFGVSRQAFEQEAARLLESLEMRKAALEKRPEASAQYRKANYRKPNKPQMAQMSQKETKETKTGGDATS